MKVALKKPITVGEGEAKKTISEIDLSKLEDLTGADVLFCSREAAAAKGSPVVYWSLDDDFRLQVMAKASGLGVEFFPKLSAPDFMEVDQKVRSFLMKLDSE